MFVPAAQCFPVSQFRHGGLRPGGYGYA